MQVTDDPVLRAEYGETVAEQFEVIAAMQRDLLAYARGEKTVLIRKVYLAKFFEGLRRQLVPELDGLRIEIVVDVQNVATAFFDETKVARAVLNLARNGIEAMAKSGGTLTLRCHADDEDLWITVTDTGTGIPKPIRRKLFEPFVTAGKTMGTGLGLSIVKRIIEEHDGFVDVQTSKLGTSFTVRLPMKLAPQSRRSPQSRSSGEQRA